MKANARRASGFRPIRKVSVEAAICAAVGFTLASCPWARAAGTYYVSNTAANGVGSLSFAILEAEAAGNGSAISIDSNLGTINASDLPDITVGMTIEGNTGNTLSGENLNRIFFVNAPGQSVQINDLALTNGLAQGGNGGSGGGGGAGLGGAVFINAGAVSFSSVAFTKNAVVGGNGSYSASGGGGGGGGLTAAGGNGGTSGMFLGAGGGGGARTSGGTAGTSTTAGAGGGVNGGAAGPVDAANDGGNGSGPDGGGGGGAVDLGAYAVNAGGNGGNGGDFSGGGGGGASLYNSGGNGGNGGFGGGGGGGADNDGAPAPYNASPAGNGGNGGFGGGGGGAGGSPDKIYTGAASGGGGGYGGGNGGIGNEGGSGGGAAFGAAVFVRSANGASVTFTDSTTDSGALTGGLGGGSAAGGAGENGASDGGAVFLMGGTVSFTVSSSTATQTIAGSIEQSSATSLIKGGAGTLAFSAVNDYSGGTTINGGELSVATDSSLGKTSGGITLNGGMLQVTGTTATAASRAVSIGSSNGGFDIPNSGTTYTLSSAITGVGSLTKVGAGTLQLNGTNTYAGSTTILAGTLIAAGGNGGFQGTFDAGSNVNVDAGTTLQLNGDDSLGYFAYSPVLNVDGGLITTDGSASHSDLGAVTLMGGTITAVGGGDSDGNYVLDGTITTLASPTMSVISADTISLRNEFSFVGGTFDVAAGGLPVDLLISSQIIPFPGQTGGLTKNGTGTLALSANNTYNGGTTVNAGTLELENVGLPPATSDIASGAVLDYSDAGRVFQDTLTLTGTGIVRKTGAGQIVFGGGGDVNVDLSAGALVDVEGGTLFGSSSYQGIWTSNLASLNIAGGATFDAVEAGPTGTMQFDALTGAGTLSGGYFANAGGISTITIGAAGGSGTFSGALQDDSGAHLAIVKSGGGTQTFTGVNTYTGGTTVSGGELVIGAAGALPNLGSVTVGNSSNGNSSTAAMLQLAANTGTTTLSSLMINSVSSVDITDNALVLQYPTGNDPATMIRGYLQTGYNGDKWNGAGIISSDAAVNPGMYAVGYADGNTDVNTPAGANQIYIKNTIAGDANLDGIVNFSDLLVVAQDYGRTSQDWAHGDFNYDGIVNFSDLLLVAQNYGKQLSAGQLAQLPGSFDAEWQLAESEVQAAQGSNVPEPASFSLTAICAVALLRRRQRNVQIQFPSGNGPIS